MMRKKGFTLLEIFLVIGLISIIATLALPYYHDFQVRNDLETSLDMTVQTLRRAQFLATSGDSNTDWGVYIDGNTYEMTVFSGSSYTARDTSKDETYPIYPGVLPTGIQEIVFSKFDGIPTSTGDIVLEGAKEESRTISVNEKGMIDF